MEFRRLLRSGAAAAATSCGSGAGLAGGAGLPSMDAMVSHAAAIPSPKLEPGMVFAVIPNVQYVTPKVKKTHLTFD